VLILLAVLLVLVSPGEVGAWGIYGMSDPVPVDLTLFRGGTFGHYFRLMTGGAESFYIGYCFPSLDPSSLTWSWDPEPPTLMPAEWDFHSYVFFNLTVPADAPVGYHESLLRAYELGGGGITLGFTTCVDVLRASVDFDPALIHQGEEDLVYCHIEPPEPMQILLGVFPPDFSWNYKTINYGPHDIDVSTVLINDTVWADPTFEEVGDFDGDGRLDLNVAFERSDVESFMTSNDVVNGTATLEVTGQFLDGWAFAGSNQLTMIRAPRTPVGGEWVPIDKLQLLAPYVGSVSLTLAIAVSFVYVKRRRKQQD